VRTAGARRPAEIDARLLADEALTGPVHAVIQLHVALLDQLRPFADRPSDQAGASTTGVRERGAVEVLVHVIWAAREDHECRCVIEQLLEESRTFVGWIEHMRSLRAGDTRAGTHRFVGAHARVSS